MTYIINYSPASVSICKGHNALTEEINNNYRHRRGDLIVSILPVHYIKYFYIVYEFDECLWTTEPVYNRLLFDKIKFLQSEGGNILGIHEYTTQPVFSQPL